MKIGLIVTSLGHGVGGHFVDAKSLYQSWKASGSDVHLICLKNPSPVFQNVAAETIRGGMVITKLKEFRFSRVFCFDLLSLILCESAGLTTAFVKCGGGNPTSFFPKLERVVAMSKENKSWFDELGYPQVKLIPNRVSRFQGDQSRVKEIQELVGDRKILLKIGRISEHYRSTLNQTIGLLGSLIEHYDCALVLVGPLESPKLKEDLISLSETNSLKDRVYFLDSPRFMREAHRLIPCADFVVGTGRGFMEAASLGKVLFAPVDEGDCAVLVTPTNIDHFLDYNISPRTPAVKNTWDKECVGFQPWVESYFDSHFNVNHTFDLYQDFSNWDVPNVRTRDLIRMAPYFFKRWYA